MLKDKQKEEAIKRMKLLNLNKNVIEELKKEDKLNLSISNGLLYWLNTEQKKIVKEFEEKYNGFVYHLIYNSTRFGEMYSLLYVSKSEDEWNYDIEDLKYNTSFVYVKNIEDDYLSEFGSIVFRNVNSGLVRTV